MPVVPFDPTPNVQPSGIPDDYQHIDANPNAFGAGVGEAMQGFGGSIQQGSGAVFDASMKRQALQNESAATDAETQYMMKAGDVFSKYQLLSGQDAVTGIKDAQSQLAQVRQDVARSLTNPAAQRAFNMMAQRHESYYLQSMQSYATQQQKAWYSNSAKSLIDTEIDQGAQFANDDQRFGNVIGTIKFKAADIAANEHLSPEQQTSLTQSYIDKAWMSRIDRIAVNDPMAAQAMYLKNRDQIGGLAQTAIEKSLKAGVDVNVAANIADSVVAGGSGHATSDLDTLFTKGVIPTESNGDQSAVSDRGAVGVAQIQQPAAQDAAKSLGVPFDADKWRNDAQYNATLGKEYLRMQLQKYGGNQTLALAAYNAGPANVDNWIAQYGDPSKGQISSQKWLKQVPWPGVQDYVQKVNDKLPPSQGTPPTSDDPEDHLAAWEEQARDAARSVRPNDPAFEEQAASRVRQKVSMLKSQYVTDYKQNSNTVLSAIIGGPGVAKPVTIDQALSSPEAKSAWAQLKPTDQYTFMKMVEENAKGTEPPMTDQAMAQFYQLKGQAATDPDAFSNVNLMDYAGKLPRNTLMELMNLQTGQASKVFRDSQKAVNLQHALGVARGPLLAAGIDTTPKEGDPAAATYNQFIGRYSTMLDQFSTDHKRQPTDSEMLDMSNRLLIQGAQAGTGHWYNAYSDKAMRAFQVDPSQFYIPVPDAERQKIVASFATSHPGVKLSDDDIRRIYTVAKMKGQGNG